MTRNLDHVKALQVLESQSLHELPAGKTLHKTEAQFISRFGWGLTRRIEEYGVSKFKMNLEKSRQGLSLVIRVLREAKRQSFGSPSRFMFPHAEQYAALAQGNGHTSSSIPSPQEIAYLACADDGDRYLSILANTSTTNELQRPKEATPTPSPAQEERTRLSRLYSWLWPSR